MFTPLRQGWRSFESLSLRIAAYSATLFISLPALAAGTAPPPLQGPAVPVDQSLRTDDRESDEISNVFRDMGVVQKRAMPKGGRFLLSTYGSFDFSDGPYTNYSLNVNPGYALSDFFEIYLNFAPLYFVSARSIVSAVQAYSQAQTGKTITILASTPKMQIGGELVWAPFYGKDSLGIRSLVRSDTFLKLGVASISADLPGGGSQSFMRFSLGLGKTFFLNRYSGIRVCVSGAWRQDVDSNLNTISRTMAIVESGLNIYL